MRFRFGILAAAAIVACGPSLRNYGSRERDVISTEELLSSTHATSDLYAAIQSLRPHFLAPPRGATTQTSPGSAPAEVYVDGRRQSGIEALRTLRAGSVEEVRYLDPVTSRNGLGPRAGGGAIMIKLLKPTPDGSQREERLE